MIAVVLYCIMRLGVLHPRDAILDQLDGCTRSSNHLIGTLVIRVKIPVLLAVLAKYCD